MRRARRSKSEQLAAQLAERLARRKRGKRTFGGARRAAAGRLACRPGGRRGRFARQKQDSRRHCRAAKDQPTEYLLSSHENFRNPPDTQ
jgi:hypothetical protein